MADATSQHVVQETLGRIAKHKGVFGYLVLSPKDGSILHSAGFDGRKQLMEAYADKLSAYATLAHSMVRTLKYDDQFQFMRLRMRMDHSAKMTDEAQKRKGTTREIIIAPDPDREKKEYVLLVVQDCPTRPPADGSEGGRGRPLAGLDGVFAGLGGGGGESPGSGPSPASGAQPVDSGAAAPA